MEKVLVIGGGFAGLSAATALAEQGHPVELLETKGFLGGRAYSIAGSESFPAPLDNGPHLFMGCYRETLRLLRRIGGEDAFHWLDPLALSWLLPGGRKVSLRCAPLPAPLHLAWGLLTSDAFPWSEKIRMARALARFSKRPFQVAPQIQTLSQFLDATGQGPAARERFWIPLCNAVMNVPPETAPLEGLGEVFRRVFFGGRKDSALGVARVPLTEMVSARAGKFLDQKGGRVRLHEGVQEVALRGRAVEVKTKTGLLLSADLLVLAVPPLSLSALLGGLWDKAASFKLLGKSPILSVHLLLSRPVLEGHFVGLSGAKFEWVFNRNANWDLKEGTQYLSFIASAAEPLVRLKDAELIELAWRELVERCPESGGAQVLHSKVTREMAATFVWNRETGPLRPPCETPFPNVFLAGDWTDTGLPATLEGACLSGHRAAEKVREYLSRES